MKTTFKNILAVAAFGLCGTVSAQNLNSAYFLDGYAYGHQLNPAKDYDRNGYVAFPVLGNFNVGLAGSLSLTDVFKLHDGRLTTFMNPNIPMSEALSDFSADNNIVMDMRMDLIGFGFHAWGGFNTFNLSLRGNMGANVPYDMFAMARKLSNRNYDLSGLSMDASVWAELGLGHSRKVTDAWRVGGKLKFLLGGAQAKIHLKQASVNLRDSQKWSFAAEAEAEMSIKGFSWGEPKMEEQNDGTMLEQVDFDNIKVDNGKLGPNGWGLAFDLGAEWDLGEQGWLDGMTISASLLDLGFISWDETHTASIKGKEIAIDGLNDIQVGDGPGVSFDDQIDKYEDLFDDLYAIQAGDQKKTAKALGATLNIGAEYKMPFYKKLSVGFLSTTRIQGRYTWNEERFSATVSPVKWFEGSINLGVGTRGTSFGWVANIHPRGLNIFFGMDHCIGRLSKQYVPLNNGVDFTLGINFPFGKSRL